MELHAKRVPLGDACVDCVVLRTLKDPRSMLRSTNQDRSNESCESVLVGNGPLSAATFWSGGKVGDSKRHFRKASPITLFVA
jgi:hypothetical protein